MDGGCSYGTIIYACIQSVFEYVLLCISTSKLKTYVYLRTRSTICTTSMHYAHNSTTASNTCSSPDWSGCGINLSIMQAIRIQCTCTDATAQRYNDNAIWMS